MSVISESTNTHPPKIKLPQIVVRERPFMEPEQIRPFIEAVYGTDVEIPALLALSSLRRSETMALRWENIDLNSVSANDKMSFSRCFNVTFFSS